jgi:GT2 family glycosyltransferase
VAAGPRAQNTPDLTVVISTLGNYETLRRVLDGYSRQDAAYDSFEVIVVVDAADPRPDAVAKAIGTRPFRVRQIIGAEPGLSSNRNAGWRAVEAPLVLFTDNDTIPVQRLVSEHLRSHREHPDEEVGILGQVRWAPELEVSTFMRWLDTGIQFNYANLEEGYVPWGAFAGANSSLKRSFVARVGDFDQEHFPYGYEDTDWAYRASKLGFRMVYNRAALVDHLRPMTFEFWKKRARRVAASERQFIRLHPEMRPWFHRVFSEAISKPRSHGRAIRVARYVPRRLPLIGARVWDRVDLAYKQALAPHFLAAWEEAEAGGSHPAQPDLSEFVVESSSGASPGGPK